MRTRYDYLPFGEELSAGVGQRSTVMGYGATDDTRQKFTAKERDTESNLDYFGARYYSSIQGRFTGVDPAIISTKRMINPQVWNAYSYVANNPLNATDPLGEELVKLGQHTDDEINKRQKEIDQQKKQIDKDKSLTKDQKKEQKKDLGC